MTKSKSGMVTKVITHLLTDTLPVLVINSAFSLLLLDRYPLPVTFRNRYQYTSSNGKFFFTTASRNVTIVRCRMSLVTIPVLDFVMIHLIHWIHRKSFRKNLNITLIHIACVCWSDLRNGVYNECWHNITNVIFRCLWISKNVQLVTKTYWRDNQSVKTRENQTVTKVKSVVIVSENKTKFV